MNEPVSRPAKGRYRMKIDDVAILLHGVDCGCPDFSPGDDEHGRYDRMARAVFSEYGDGSSPNAVRYGPGSFGAEG